MKSISALIIGLVALSGSTLAGEPTRMTRVARTGSNQFQTLFLNRDNKLSWSRILPGKYTNGCVDEYGSCVVRKCTQQVGSDGKLQVKIEDSEAAKACRNLGARLPTLRELLDLIKSFDYTEGPYGPQLTQKGFEEMQVFFGNLELENFLWSSSIDSIYPYTSYSLPVENGRVGSIYRCYGHEVTCVIDR